MAINPDIKAAAIKDMRSGKTQYATAKKWGIAAPTLAKWRKELGIEISYHITSLAKGYSSSHVVVETVK